MKTGTPKKLSAEKLKIAIVKARFNSEVTDGLLRGALKAFVVAGLKTVKVYEVPGSFEIPIFCQRLARTKKFDGLIALGAVVKGETAHFKHIAQAATDGIMKVMLSENLPIAFGVLTAYNKKQALIRSKDDKNNKGAEAAAALIETLINLKNV